MAVRWSDQWLDKQKHHSHFHKKCKGRLWELSTHHPQLCAQEDLEWIIQKAMLGNMEDREVISESPPKTRPTWSPLWPCMMEWLQQWSREELWTPSTCTSLRPSTQPTLTPFSLNWIWWIDSWVHEELAGLWQPECQWLNVQMEISGKRFFSQGSALGPVLSERW